MSKKSIKEFRKMVEKNNEYLYTLIYIMLFGMILMAIVSVFFMYSQYRILGEMAAIWNYLL